MRGAKFRQELSGDKRGEQTQWEIKHPSDDLQWLLPTAVSLLSIGMSTAHGKKSGAPASKAMFSPQEERNKRNQGYRETITETEDDHGQVVTRTPFLRGLRSVPHDWRMNQNRIAVAARKASGSPIKQELITGVAGSVYRSTRYFVPKNQAKQRGHAYDHLLSLALSPRQMTQEAEVTVSVS